MRKNGDFIRIITSPSGCERLTHRPTKKKGKGKQARDEVNNVKVEDAAVEDAAVEDAVAAGVDCRMDTVSIWSCDVRVHTTGNKDEAVQPKKKKARTKGADEEEDDQKTHAQKRQDRAKVTALSSPQCITYGNHR